MQLPRTYIFKTEKENKTKVREKIMQTMLIRRIITILIINFFMNFLYELFFRLIFDEILNCLKILNMKLYSTNLKRKNILLRKIA